MCKHIAVSVTMVNKQWKINMESLYANRKGKDGRRRVLTRGRSPVGFQRVAEILSKNNRLIYHICSSILQWRNWLGSKNMLKKRLEPVKWNIFLKLIIQWGWSRGAIAGQWPMPASWFIWSIYSSHTFLGYPTDLFYPGCLWEKAYQPGSSSERRVTFSYGPILWSQIIQEVCRSHSVLTF